MLWGGQASKGRGAVLVVAYVAVAVAFFLAGDREDHGDEAASPVGTTLTSGADRQLWQQTIDERAHPYPEAGSRKR